MKTIPYPVEIRFSPTPRDSLGNRPWRNEYPLEDAPADFDELERWAAIRDFEPILAIPNRGTSDLSAPWEVSIHECINPRLAPPSKLEELEDELKSTYALFEIVKRRIPGPAKFAILKSVRFGVLGIDDITHDDIRELARLDRKARILERRINRLVYHRDSRV